MNVTTANAVCQVINALAGDGRVSANTAENALEVLSAAAHKRLMAGPSESTLADAQEFLVERCREVTS